MMEGSILSQGNIRHQNFLSQNANFPYYSALSHTHLSSEENTTCPSCGCPVLFMALHRNTHFGI